MTQMIIDCDPGHDDAIALILAHQHADVLGITTVTGNAPLAATTANALTITALIGADTPVHRGASRPLVGEPKHAQAVHGESGLGGVTPLVHDRVVASEDAVDFLLEAAADVWIVAIGPLTNLALAIDRDPTWARRVAGISIMGGSTTIGNATRVAEFNVYADPEAAAKVFSAGAKLTMCGLNLTHQLRTSDMVIENLRAAKASRANFAVQVLEFLHARMADLSGRNEAILHDPCAVLAVTHPDLIETQPRVVDVEVAGKLTRGMTVVDQRVTRLRDQANVNVAYRIDAARAMDLVMKALGADPKR
jgi:inosine-uridine nucleoside N-ribohydrolase